MTKQNNYELENDLLNIRLLFLRSISQVWESDKIHPEKISHRHIDKLELNDEQNNMLKKCDAEQSVNLLAGFTRDKKSNCKLHEEDLPEVLSLQVLEKFTNKNSDHTNSNRWSSWIAFAFSEKLNLNSPRFSRFPDNPCSDQIITELNTDLRNLQGVGDAFMDVVKLFSENGLLRYLVELFDSGNLKYYWSKAYHSTLDFNTFGIQLTRATARWDQYGNGEWTKPNSEALYLTVPVTKNIMEIDDPITKSTTLTSYYQYFPSFLGQKHEAPNFNGAKKDQKRKFVSARSSNMVSKYKIDPTLDIGDLQNPYKLASTQGNDYALGISNGQFFSFSSVLIKLIPVIWNNKALSYRLNYLQRLIDETSVFKNGEDDSVKIEFNSLEELSYCLGHLDGEKMEEHEAFNVEYDNEIRAIFKEHFSYESPWIFTVRLIYPESFRELIDNENQLQDYDLPVLNLTTIEIPHAPDTDNANGFALALARYNATGPAYPFTCS